MPKKKRKPKPKSLTPPKTKPYPVRLTPEVKAEIQQTAEVAGLTFPEAMRQALKFGLPLVRRRFRCEQTPDLPAAGLTPAEPAPSPDPIAHS